MKRLTEKESWEPRNDSLPGVESDAARHSLKSRIINRFFGKLDRGYPRYLIYDVECRRYFPEGECTVIEIGSAPGRELITVHRKFGYVPYGVEYTENGVKANRNLFLIHGIDPENVIHADFFDRGFQEAYCERFDVVMSHGFIEHFTDLNGVIAGHVNLLKPGGLLLITIPNLRGFNWPVSRFFSKRPLKAHNQAIIKKKKLLFYCDREELAVLRCKYIGTLNFGITCERDDNTPKQFLMDLLKKLQRVIDITLYTFFRRGCIETPFFSPKLLIICRKRTTTDVDAQRHE